MNEEELKEDRKLILDFLNWETYELKSHIHSPELQFSTTMYKVPLKFNLPFNHLRFHDDWNLLMLVVEKIERLSFEVSFVLSRCRISKLPWAHGEYWVNVEEDTKIKAVYESVINFIKWYNTQEK